MIHWLGADGPRVPRARGPTSGDERGAEDAAEGSDSSPSTDALDDRTLGIRLRPVLQEDSHWIRRGCENVEILRWWRDGRPIEADEAEALVTGLVTRHREGRAAAFVVIDDGGVPLGYVAVDGFDARDGVGEVSYWTCRRPAVEASRARH